MNKSQIISKHVVLKPNYLMQQLQQDESGSPFAGKRIRQSVSPKPNSYAQMMLMKQQKLRGLIG